MIAAGTPTGADCDDNDSAVWQELSYSFRDADGDGHTIASPGTLCVGRELPSHQLKLNLNLNVVGGQRLAARLGILDRIVAASSKLMALAADMLGAVPSVHAPTCAATSGEARCRRLGHTVR